MTQGVGRPAALLAPPDQAGRRRREPGADRQVLGRREVVEQAEVLVHGVDAEPARQARIAETHLRAEEPSLRAVVGIVVPGQHLDERRLAAPVLPDECHHLAPFDTQLEIVERHAAGERLAQAANLEQRRAPRQGNCHSSLKIST